MTTPETHVLLSRVESLQQSLAEVKADLLRFDDRQRQALASLARLEATAKKGSDDPPASTALGVRGQVAANSGIFAVMLGLVEIIRALALG